MTDQSSGQPTDSPTKSAAAKLFDIRVLIGGLFTLYGVLLTIYSFFTSDVEVQKAAGININLGLGLGMLALGLVFLLWVRLAPIRPPDPDTVDTDRPAAH